ncbi:hypothetical protein FNV43_RR02804 [Rhamnella rubrinervis]|uniref:ZF-HD dimerization-type domain-containing protein n=1 Tax=Rhamnella rubrinervis TaxID=2594499 RepID=A0A8K0HGK6_9ROSA|nr:hypothetical protein FNV43_RR02804 [Rhamnella rubrinervis]
MRTTIKYKECVRNHAASMGGHAVDGCREFTAHDDDDDHHHHQDLLCAACGCHRNFHRKEMIHNGVPMNITSRYVTPTTTSTVTTTSVPLMGPNNCHKYYLWTGEERKVIVLRPTPYPPPGFSNVHHPDHHNHYNYEHGVLYGHDHHEVEAEKKPPTKRPKMEI